MCFWQWNFRDFFKIVAYCIHHPKRTWHIITIDVKHFIRWSFATLPRRIVASILIALFILMPVANILFVPKIQAAWWNDAWLYRKSIAVSNSSGSTLNDFQVKILDNKDLSIDITAGKIQSTLNDLRFTDINGKILPYWIEDLTVTSIDVWAKVSNIPTSGTTVYMYYGNMGAIAGKSMTGTQDFPGLSCKAIKLSGQTANGAYYINPSSGSVTGAYQAYCDLIRDGGGWTLGIKDWYLSGAAGNVNALGAIADATAHKGNPYKLSDIDIRTIIGPSQNFALLADQDGYNSAYSTGNYEYVIARNYTGYWRFDTVVAASSTTTSFQSYRLSDNALAWTGNFSCGIGGWGINCYTITSGNVPGGGSGCAINMGKATDPSWHHFYMAETNTDTYLYICNGPQHTSSYDLNHRWWFRETTINRSTNITVVAPSTEEKSPGPSAYWKFDEGTGIIANDSVSSNGVIATGGTVTDVGGYRIHTFTSSGSFTVTNGGAVESLVVAGGGSGGGAGGGGGGGVIYTTYLTALGATAVTVGNGGAIKVANGVGNNGENSVFGSLVAVGGGGGGSYSSGAGVIGGSGGGGGACNLATTVAGSGTIEQGYAGGAGDNVCSPYHSGGGGGAGGIGGSFLGASSGSGGIGRQINIDGNNYYYGGGGGGGAQASGTVGGNGGLGGGGGGAQLISGTAGTGGGSARNSGANGQQVNTYPPCNGGAGGANTGGGGGGMGVSVSNGGAGGSGIVIIRYPITNNGTLTNMASPASPTSGWQTEDKCISGKCLAFDGVDDYVQPASAYNPGTSDFTLSAWVKRLGSDGDAIISFSSGSYAVGLYSNYAETGIHFGTGYDSASSVVGPILETNTWKHLVGVREGTTLKIYINGILSTTKTGVAIQNIATNYLQIGRMRSGQHEWRGNIDEPKIYNYARSAAQIKLDYNAGISGAGANSGTTASFGDSSDKWMSDGLVGHWKMDETNGNAIDSSGNGNVLTNTNTATFTAGKFGNAGNLVAASSQYFTCTDANCGGTSKLDTPTTFTTSAWINSTNVTANNQQIISKSDGSSGANAAYELRFNGTSGKIQFVGYIGGAYQSIISSTVLSNNTWYLATVTYDGVNLKLFLNGILDSTPVATTGSMSDSAANFAIGGRGDGYYFNGKIDEARVYKRALSTKEISSLYEWAPGPVAYYNMEEGGGTTANDTSGNNNTGTVFGNSNIATGKFGKGRSFDGVGDGINLGSSAILDFGNNGAFTFSGWVNPTVLVDYAGFVSKDTAGRSSPYSYMTTFMANGRLSAYNNSTWADICPAASVAIGIWQYITFDYNGTNITGYVNGKSCGSIAFSYPDNGAYDVTIGSWYAPSAVYDFNGLMDDVKIYNYARTPKQIMQDMTGNVASSDLQTNEEATAYYKFDEGSGSVAKDIGNSFVLGGTGGNTVQNIGGYRIHTFTSSGTFTATSASNIEYLIVAGGGGGGYGGTAGGGGGGGAGGLLTSMSTVSAGAIAVTVGNGGSGGNNGGNSALGAITAYGGGHGGVGGGASGFSGGSGGGGNPVSGSGGAGTPGQGYQGGNVGALNQGDNGSAGGGGAGAAAADAVWTNTGTAGGSGLSSNISGSSVMYATGGAGGWGTYWGTGQIGATGAVNTGNGAGGAGYNGTPGSGGSGVVIIRYPITNDGTLTNISSPATSTSGWTNSGKFGKALNFDGMNDYVNVGNSPNFNPGDGYMTISAWIKTSSATDQAITYKEGGGNQFNFRVLPTGNLRLNVYGNTNSYDDSVPTVNDGNWHNVIAIWLKTDMKFFMDGVEVSKTHNGTYPTSSILPTGNQYIGGRVDSATSYFSGTIDEVKFYSYALSADDVKIEYNRGSSTSMASSGSISVGNTADSASAEYCIPGDASACSPPVGEWKLDENTGTIANDTSGNNNTGTLTNGPIWDRGKFGSGVRFDGIGDTIQKTSPGAVLGLGQNGTMGAWIKPDAFGGASCNSHNGTGSCRPIIFNYDYGYFFGLNNDGALILDLGNGSSWVSISNTAAGKVVLNQWQYVAVTLSGGTALNFYVNGVLAGTSTISSSNFTNLYSIGIGGNTAWTSVAFSGSIDQVRIYNYARTPAQIAYDYNRGAPIGWWKMDECQGTTINDASGNSNNGTLTVGATGTQNSAGTCTATSTAWGNGANGKFNSSLNFDGTDDWIKKTSLRFSNNKQKTISLWLKTNTLSSTQYLVSFSNDANNYKWQSLALANQSISWMFGDDSFYNERGVTGDVITQTGAWYHLVVTVDITQSAGNRVKLFVNGQSITTTLSNDSGNSFYDGTDLNMYIGAFNYGTGVYGYFNGAIDDVRIYNYALTSKQIISVMNEDSALRFGPTSGM
ncbi:MAG: DUF2341 domain-containing protein [Candidatus Moraniibacteriota bacterium]